MATTEVAYHRNGVSGEGFHVVKFDTYNPFQFLVGVVFHEPGHVAVFNRELLGKGVIAFGENSYQGDHFEPGLRKMIADSRDLDKVDGRDGKETER
jgi:hypothetical protein